MTTETTMVVKVAGPGWGGRMSRQHNCHAVLRLLQGKDLETLSHVLGLPAATLSGWRDTFLSAGETSLVIRPVNAGELESDRLEARLSGLPERKLLETRVAALEDGRRLVWRRSRR